MDTPFVSSQRVVEIINALKSDNLYQKEQGSADLAFVYGDLLTEWIMRRLGEKSISNYYTEFIRTMTLLKVAQKIDGFIWKQDNPNGFYKWVCAFASNYIRNLDKTLNPPGQKLNPDERPLISLNYLLDKKGGDYLSEASSIFSQTEIHAPPEEQLIYQEFRLYIKSLHQRSLGRLSPLHQQIVEEFHINEITSLKEIAVQSGYSYSHVRNEAGRALAMYRTYFCETLIREKQDQAEQLEYVYLIEQIIGTILPVTGSVKA